MSHGDICHFHTDFDVDGDTGVGRNRLMSLPMYVDVCRCMSMATDIGRPPERHMPATYDCHSGRVARYISISTRQHMSITHAITVRQPT